MPTSRSQTDPAPRAPKLSVVMLNVPPSLSTMPAIALATEFTNSLRPPGLNSAQL
jgi:hypothetical protein